MVVEKIFYFVSYFRNCCVWLLLFFMFVVVFDDLCVYCVFGVWYDVLCDSVKKVCCKIFKFDIVMCLF